MAGSVSLATRPVASGQKAMMRSSAWSGGTQPGRSQPIPVARATRRPAFEASPARLGGGPAAGGDVDVPLRGARACADQRRHGREPRRPRHPGAQGTGAADRRAVMPWWDPLRPARPSATAGGSPTGSDDGTSLATWTGVGTRLVTSRPRRLELVGAEGAGGVAPPAAGDRTPRRAAPMAGLTVRAGCRRRGAARAGARGGRGPCSGRGCWRSPCRRAGRRAGPP